MELSKGENYVAFPVDGTHYILRVKGSGEIIKRALLSYNL